MEEEKYVDPKEIREMIRAEARRALERWEALPWWRKLFSMLVVRWQLFKDRFRPRDDIDDFLDEMDEKNDPN